MKLTTRSTAYWDIYACAVSLKCWWLQWKTLNRNEKERVSFCFCSLNLWLFRLHLKGLMGAYSRPVWLQQCHPIQFNSSVIDPTDVSMSLSDWHCWGQVVGYDWWRDVTEVCPQCCRTDSTSMSDRMIEMLTCQYRVNAAEEQVSASKVTACQCFVLAVWLSSQCCPEYKEPVVWFQKARFLFDFRSSTLNSCLVWCIQNTLKLCMHSKGLKSLPLKSSWINEEGL